MNVPLITSPCTGVCKLDAETQWCIGCGRSGDELAQWGSGPEDWRQAVWDAIPERLARFGVASHRLPWTTDDIRAFVRRSLQQSLGRWVAGVPGASAQFAANAADATQVFDDGSDLVAQHAGGTIRFVLDDDVRALGFDRSAGWSGHGIVMLVVKRERRWPARAPGIADLGPAAEGRRRFDLGLARKDCRAVVAVPEGPAAAAMTGLCGSPFADAAPAVRAALQGPGQSCGIETALGQITVKGPLVWTDQVAPNGTTTLQVSPGELALNQNMPVGLEVPRAYRPGAVFYPNPSLT